MVSMHAERVAVDIGGAKKYVQRCSRGENEPVLDNGVLQDECFGVVTVVKMILWCAMVLGWVEEQFRSDHMH